MQAPGSHDPGHPVGTDRERDNTVTPNIIASTPRDHGTFWCRSTELHGVDWHANATEFGDPGAEPHRLTLSIHPKTWEWPATPVEVTSGIAPIHGNVVNGTVSIDIGSVSITIPTGHEHTVLRALIASITELTAQKAAGTDNTCCVVNLTGNVDICDDGWRREDDDTHALPV